MNPNPALASLCNEQLLSATREILRRACIVEADLLVHLAEIEERRLHLDMACSSMFAFCVMKLGFSEDATYNRLGVAHAGRQFPAVLDALRSGEMHLSGLNGAACSRTGGCLPFGTAALDCAALGGHLQGG